MFTLSNLSKDFKILTNRISLLGLAILLALVSFSNVEASLVVGDHIRFSNQVGTDAGEFGIAKTSDLNTDLFRTFCVETNEYINFSSHYHVDSIQDGILNGGSGGGSPDYLDGKTKWLYWNFRNGTLASYGGNDYWANQLQNAIWRLEDENHSVSKSTFYYDLAVAAELAGDASWTIAQSRVTGLNISRVSDGRLAQSMLFLTDPPSGESVVPEPGSLVIWSLLGFACMRARRRSS